MEKPRRNQRDGFGHSKPAATPGQGRATGDGASGDLSPEDLSRFEGEGGLAVPEPFLRPSLNRRNQFSEPKQEMKS
jgi:hypothetical protein